MTSDAFFSFYNFHLHSIRALNQKTNPKQTQPNRPTPTFSDEKPPQKARARKVITSKDVFRRERKLCAFSIYYWNRRFRQVPFHCSICEWLKLQKQDVAVVNLDPGALKLPYSPDVDVRNYVDVGDIMEKYALGPNGAVILAADLIADEIENLTRDIEEAHADIVLVDTPGQMELFAFRASGPYIVDELTKEPKALIYLFDAVFSINPLNYVSNMFLAAAVYNRFFQPQLHVLSKTDLIPKNDVQTIASWSANPRALEEAIDQNSKAPNASSAVT